MKKFLKFAVLAALSFTIFSCQKDKESESINIQELSSYMDTAGEEALSQIQPSDFQRLADLVNSFPEDPSKLEIDDVSKGKLIALALSLLEYRIKDKESVVVINFDKINGTFTIQGNKISYDTKLLDTNKTIVFITDANTYTADFTVTTPNSPKEVYLGEYEIEEGKSKYKVYFKIPTGFTAKVTDDAGLYMGTTVKNINCSQMSADWSALTLDQVNCSFSGTGYINGFGSYRAENSKISIALGKASLEGGVLYGREGKPFATGYGSVNFSVPSSPTESEIDIDWSSLSFYGNLIEKIVAKSNDNFGADLYFNPIDTKQLSIALETGEVTFNDGTKMPSEEFFNENNFPKSYKSASEIIGKFSEMFGFDF